MPHLDKTCVLRCQAGDPRRGQKPLCRLEASTLFGGSRNPVGGWEGDGLTLSALGAATRPKGQKKGDDCPFLFTPRLPLETIAPSFCVSPQTPPPLPILPPDRTAGGLGRAAAAGGSGGSGQPGETHGQARATASYDKEPKG